MAQRKRTCLQCRRRRRHGLDPWVGETCREAWVDFVFIFYKMDFLFFAHFFLIVNKHSSEGHHVKASCFNIS